MASIQSPLAGLLLGVTGQRWRADAACARHPEPWLWDERLDDGDDDDPGAREGEYDRLARHRQAKTVCWRQCPVRAECAADVGPGDSGVRGGHALPALHANARGQNGSARDIELRRLLARDIPLDVAAPRADRLLSRPARGGAA